MAEDGMRITENYHPGDFGAFSASSQILLEPKSTNEDLWEKKMPNFLLPFLA